MSLEELVPLASRSSVGVASSFPPHTPSSSLMSDSLPVNRKLQPNMYYYNTWLRYREHH